MTNTDDILDYTETEQDVDDFIASNGIRFANYLVDYVITTGIVFGIPFLLSNSLDSDEYLFDNNPVLDYGFSFLILLLYYIVMEGISNQTVGKFLTRTRVVSEHGGKPAFMNIVGRSFCRLIPFEAFSFLGSANKGWHDTMSKTKVVTRGYIS